MSSETRELTITLASGANIQFAVHPDDPEGREIFPEREVYDKGETVKVHLAIANIGDTADRGNIEVVDLDTGATIKTFTRPAYPTPALKPAYKWSSTSPIEIGSMPDHDWRLQFTVTP